MSEQASQPASKHLYSSHPEHHTTSFHSILIDQSHEYYILLITNKSIAARQEKKYAVRSFVRLFVP